MSTRLAVLDAELLRLAEEWRANREEHEQLAWQADGAEGNPADEARLLLALERNAIASYALDARIAALPARTLAGLRAKATIADRNGLGAAGALEQSLLDDIARLAGAAA